MRRLAPLLDAEHPHITEQLALHRGIIVKTVHRFRLLNPLFDWDDLMSEALLTAAYAIRNYRKDSGLNMVGWLAITVRRRLFQLVAPWRYRKAIVSLFCDICGDGWEMDVASYPPDIAQLEEDDLFAYLKRSLSPTHGIILEKHFRDGETLADVGRELGISREAVRQQVRTICKLIQVEMLRQGVIAMHRGDKVRLLLPENERLHNQLAVIDKVESWGAHVLCEAAAFGEFRALWTEMQLIAQPTGDVCNICGGSQLVRTGSCITCQDCGANEGCG